MRCSLMTGMALATVPLLCAPGRAAELVQPVLLSATGEAANPAVPAGCTLLGPESTVRYARLIVRNTVRHDVGPYAVQLPGYATNLSDPSNDSYAPTLIAANPGDTLRIDLVNQLVGSDSTPNAAEDQPLGLEINLHTHGLITQPHSAAPCGPPGDYVFTQTDPGNTTSYRIDIPATLPGRMFGSTNAPTSYPSGLTWFHAHVHPSTQDDVTAGASGFLTVGDPISMLLATPGASAADVAALNATTEVYMGLRDIQLAVPPGTTPDSVAPATPAAWIRSLQYDFQACRTLANPTLTINTGNGWCGHAGVLDQGGNLSDGSHDTAWLFTVNGQKFPNVTLQAGQNNIWRIANLSDTTTYVLELNDNATGLDQSMQVLSLDGVVAGTNTNAAGTTLQLGVGLRQILMMPATRAEIFVPNTATSANQILTLRTTAVETGVNPPNPPRAYHNGFSTPAINLASVTMLAGQTQPSGPLSLSLAGAAATTQSNTRTTATSTLAQYAPAPTNCITLPQYGGTSYGFRRQVIFGLNNNDQVGSTIVNAATGRSIDASGTGPNTIPSGYFPMADMLNPSADPHVCPRLGEQEVWEIVNDSFEMHNFHIHQAKFRLSVPGDRGVPPGFTAAGAIVDPAGIVTGLMPEVSGQTPSANVDVWHDTIPVPPMDFNGNPGRIFVTIPFLTPQQVGASVFHCHILQHEDEGMMAVVQVYDPLGQYQAAEATQDIDAAIRGSTCGAPARSVLPTPGETLLNQLRTMISRRT